MKNNKLKARIAIYSRQIFNENGEQEGKERSFVVRYPDGMPLPDIQDLMTQFIEEQGMPPFPGGCIENATIKDIIEVMDNANMGPNT